MRILFLNNFHYLRGGSEKVMFEEMRILREAGHTTTVFARGHERNEPAEFQEFFPPSLNTERLKASLQSLRTVKELVYSHTARRGLREVIRRFRPDVAHGHNIYGRLSLAVLDELKRAGIPVVLTLHDLKILCPSYLMLNHGEVCERCRGGKFRQAVRTRCHKGSLAASAVYALESYFNHRFGKYGSVARFIAPSRFLRDKCIEYGWHPDRIVHLPNFIDGSHLPLPVERGDYLLYMGRLSREKGVLTLLEAYGRLSRPLPLKIVGDGPERKQLERKAREEGLSVHFAGYLSGEELHNALAGARAVLLPSEWYENAPLSLLEAFAAGKPVLGARIGGIPEMIEEGINGLLFDSARVESLEKAMRHFLSLPAERVAAMGNAARLRIEQSFTAAAHLEKLTALYRQVSGRRA